MVLQGEKIINLCERMHSKIDDYNLMQDWIIGYTGRIPKCAIRNPQMGMVMAAPRDEAVKDDEVRLKFQEDSVERVRIPMENRR
ncbi:hypothetical protein EVAR_53292_1 [Eumeta japonica]|uniref:Uncharacterized protein n=1 Tax=Eumeta variegata TaxID=151549 RepID=A0A4C1YVE2_EUMVA|nr:hypothetical protein EVAR_53292_1 [Eumeta japonica]